VVADDAATQWRSPEPRTAQNRGDFVSSCAQCNELADRASPVVVANFAGGDLEGGETPSPRVVPTPWGLLLQPASNADAAVTLLLLRVLMRRVTEVVLAIATKRCWESGSGSTAMRKRPTHPSHNPNPNPTPGQTLPYDDRPERHRSQQLVVLGVSQLPTTARPRPVPTRTARV
jgi:hypothetical protein